MNLEQVQDIKKLLELNQEGLSYLDSMSIIRVVENLDKLYQETKIELEKSQTDIDIVKINLATAEESAKVFHEASSKVVKSVEKSIRTHCGHSIRACGKWGCSSLSDMVKPLKKLLRALKKSETEVEDEE